MKKPYLIIYGILIFIISIPIILYLLFTIGTVYSSSAKAIDTDWVKQYKTNMKTDFISIRDIKIYDQFGRVHFDFTVDPKMSVDEYNQVVKKTKDLVLKETISKLYGDQLTLRVKFDSKKDIYVYESPYWVPTEDVTDNPNKMIENNYKVWYLQINDKPGIKIQF